ncbi:tetratricopeptide repeat protein [Dyadobacter jejuensis]|uniref:Tetratricopeptide repeat protein n=1 Tax=Dyadobacter jejuensis TaxID=1082580 RepID=A0A316AMA2_9BACT|nr:histidine kinase [Dyadobacter jejuensis]PWJ58863.1 tetratricopeptide repeat protein [Dyadobacter jejuensis]
MSFIFRNQLHLLWIVLLVPLVGVLPLQGQPVDDVISSDKGLSALTSTGNFAKDTMLINKYNQLARKYLFHDASVTIRYAKEALALCQKNHWDRGKLDTYNLLSTYYLIDGSYDILREISNESYNLSIKLDLPVYKAYAERFLAESYAEYREFDKAYFYFESALATFIKYKADSAQALCLENIANYHREKNEWELAEENYNKAYQLNDQLNNPFGKASVLQSEGYMCLRRLQFQKAENLFYRALAINKSINNRYGLLNVYNDLNNFYYITNDFDKSIEIGKLALDFSKRYHSTLHTNWALNCLAKAYKKKNDLPTTVEYLEQISFLRRLTHQERIERQFTMSQLMFDNKQMDIEIQNKTIEEQNAIQVFLIGILVLSIIFAIFLWRANINLRKKNVEIKGALIKGQTLERKRVAAELHDSLGGTLASLNWYLYGIDKKILPDHERTIYNSIQQMVGKAYKDLRSLSHNLMPDDLETHGLVLTIQRLVDKLNENNEISFTFDVSGLDERLGSKVEFEMYSIILELTNNILKHAQAKLARIQIEADPQFINLTVSDDGIGLRVKTDGGMGLGNVRNRVQSLSGTLKIQIENGTFIFIKIPRT